MLWVSTVVFVAVMLFLAVALMRGVRQARRQSAPSPDRQLSRAVALVVVATVVILFVLLGASIWTDRSVAPLQASSALTIAVTGHQWWWEIQYEDGIPSQRVVTANEIHVPVDRQVVLKVTSRDVIHSFWAPNLQGKRDLVPGYTTAIWIQPTRTGIFRGQCAEFCGLQHARMAFDVVVEPQADFERWLDAMRRPARDPETDAARHGRDVFMSNRCPACHTVRGTDAGGLAGPDLTHVATRSTLGAGTLSNTRDHLVSWVRDPQESKPGNQMPPNPLGQADLQAVAAYLEALP